MKKQSRTNVRKAPAQFGKRVFALRAAALFRKRVFALRAPALFGKRIFALRAASLFLCGLLVMTAAGSVCARAADRPEGMDDETWNRLRDNVMEYDELENLVKCFNPSYQQILDSVMPMVETSRETASQMRSSEDLKAMKDSSKELKKALDQMNPASEVPAEQMAYQQTYTMYLTLQAGIQGVEQGARAINKTAAAMNRQTSSVRGQTLYSLTAAVQQMFIGYNQALASREICEAAAELSEAAAQSAQTQRSVGMATDNDVLSAQQSLLSAQNQITSLDNTLSSLRQNLYVMTGWTYDASAEIGTVPAPDLEKIDAMNPDVDIAKAIANSYSLKTLNDTLKSSKAASSVKESKKAEARAELKTQLETLYQTVLADKAAYETSAASLEAARLTQESNERQYELGMIGRLQYLQAKLAYLQQKLTAGSASMTLTQSILDYEWALKGILMSGQTGQ